MSKILVLQCTHNEYQYSERYDIESTSTYELMHAISQSILTNCSYIFKKNVILDNKVLQQKCASLQSQLLELNAATPKDAVAINEVVKELSGASSYLKNKTAKISRAEAWYNGITQLYIVDDESKDEGRMINIGAICYMTIAPDLDKFYNYLIELNKIDASLLIQAGFHTPEKPALVEQVVEKVKKPKPVKPA